MAIQISTLEAAARRAQEGVTAIEIEDLDVVALNNAAHEAEGLISSFDEALATTDTLVVMRGAVSAMVDEGGMTPPTAQAVRVAVEQMANRLGFPADQRGYPALEHFQDERKRLVATKVAMEGLGRMIGEVWEAILGALKKVGLWIKQFFSQMAYSMGHARDRAERYEARAQQLKGWSARPNSVILPGKGDLHGFARILHVGGKVEADQLAAHLQAHLRQAEKLYRNETELASIVQADLEKAMRTAGHPEGQAWHLDSAQAAFIHKSPKTKATNREYAVAGMLTVAEPLTFGGMSYYCLVPEGKPDLALENANLHRFVAATTSAGGRQVGDVVPLNAQQILQVLPLVNKLIDDISELPSFVGKIERLHVDARTAMNKLVRQSQEGDRQKTENESRNLAVFANLYIKTIMRGTKALRGYDMAVVRATLDYVAASLKFAGPIRDKEED